MNIEQSARFFATTWKKTRFKNQDQCWLSAPHHNRDYWRAAQLSPNQHPVKYETCQRWQRLKNDPTQLQITLKMSDGVDSTESISVLSFWFELIWFKQINEIINTANWKKGWWFTILLKPSDLFTRPRSLGSCLWVSMADCTRAFWIFAAVIVNDDTNSMSILLLMPIWINPWQYVINASGKG